MSDEKKPRVPVPSICQEDYDRFVTLPTSDIPKTFNEWRDDRFREEREYLRHGFEVVVIPIHPEECIQFCRETSPPGRMDFRSIRGLVEKKFRTQENARERNVSVPSQRPGGGSEGADC
jgi:hypothetical protein